ncbi:MAG: histidine phosphatase family protein [Caldilinea sp.]|nr:histidine phosphatase family protein [Caldilinea sp.]MDW8439822.1 histidine phosphatase family protein [Caldilineaceae bacterium]
MRLLLVRHGQSVNNVLADKMAYDEYIATRSHEPDLTPVGEEQVRRLAQFFGDALQPDADLTERRASISEQPVTALYTSPMLRALRTSAPLAAVLGLAPAVWVDIHEHGGLFTGDPRNGTALNFSGMGKQEMQRRFPGFILPPEVTDDGWWWNGYETLEQCAVRAQRVAETLRAWAKTRKDDVLLMVTHGTFMDQLLKALIGAGEQSTFFFSHLNTGVSRVDFLESGLIALRYLNRVPHLPPELYTR